MSPVQRSRLSALLSLPWMMCSCTSRAKPWQTSHEPCTDSRCVQRQDSIIGEDVVRSSLGAVGITDSSVWVNDVKDCMERGTEILLLLRDRTNGHHRFRLWS